MYGVAADWTWTGLKKSVTGGSGSTSYELKINWLASFRGRAGLAVDLTLLYVTGGVALAGVKDLVIYSWDVPSTHESTSTKVGWVAGAGVEHRFTPNWSMKLEYLHYELGDHSAGWDIVADGTTHTELRFDHSVDVGRVGLAYRFN